MVNKESTRRLVSGVRIEADDHAAISEIAKSEGVGIATVARRLIKQALAQHGRRQNLETLAGIHGAKVEDWCELPMLYGPGAPIASAVISKMLEEAQASVKREREQQIAAHPGVTAEQAAQMVDTFEVPRIRMKAG